MREVRSDAAGNWWMPRPLAGRLNISRPANCGRQPILSTLPIPPSELRRQHSTLITSSFDFERVCPSVPVTDLLRSPERDSVRKQSPQLTCIPVMVLVTNFYLRTDSLASSPFPNSVGAFAPFSTPTICALHERSMR